MKLSLGLDFGTDSVRALLVDTKNGEELFSSVSFYKRWKQKLFCNASKQQFRHHPKDYLESLEIVILDVLSNLPIKDRKQIKGIGVTTTGSTPIAIDCNGIALALHKKFEENPNAMFILWKDHTAINEAAEINNIAHNHSLIDYTKYIGGSYSSEWIWAKILHTYRVDSEILKDAYSWIELCDWIPAILTNTTHPEKIKRGICAAGHKALWHKEWGGLPSNEFWTKVDSKLDGVRDRLQSPTYSSEHSAGNLSAEWAEKLGLEINIPIAMGGFDVHIGAIGAGISDYTFTRVMGTSTCDIVTVPAEKEILIKGICGQVDGSVREGKIGYEAGQSAYGDLLAWWGNVISLPAYQVAQTDPKLFGTANIEEWQNAIFMNLVKQAENMEQENSIIAIDWINGRRTPFANQNLTGWVGGMNLGSDAAEIMRAWIVSLACGGRKIMECFEDQGILLPKVIALGGVARKSSFIMQISSNIMNRPIEVVKSDQCCALGAAIFGAVVAKIYPNIQEAMDQMASPIDKLYSPDSNKVKEYEKKYQDYLKLSENIEQYINKN